MKECGNIIVGASGDLGQCLWQSLPEDDENFGFDLQESRQLGIKYLDIADERQIEDMLDDLSFEQAQKWCLCSCVGMYSGGDVDYGDTSALVHSIKVNLVGITALSVGFAHRLSSLGKTGRIVLVSSAAAIVGSRDIGYGVSKAGLHGLVKSLSKIWARSGITVIGVSPGIFESKMSRSQAPERRFDAVSANHLGRMLKVTEVRDVCLFAMQNAPDAMTGTIIYPSGGQV